MVQGSNACFPRTADTAVRRSPKTRSDSLSNQDSAVPRRMRGARPCSTLPFRSLSYVLTSLDHRVIWCNTIGGQTLRTRFQTPEIHDIYPKVKKNPPNPLIPTPEICKNKNLAMNWQKKNGQRLLCTKVTLRPKITCLAFPQPQRDLIE